VTVSTRVLAQAYVETDQTGAQTQIDVNHSSTFYLGVVSSIQFGGGNFVMKRGSATSALDKSTLTLYANSVCSGTVLAAVDVDVSAFTGSYAAVSHHFAAPVSLNPGAYCAKLTSTAPDVQSQAYFIKGLENCTVLPADQANGTSCGVTVPILNPNLTLAKAQPTPGLAVGQQSTYVLTVTNSGNAAATTARVVDLLPSGLSYVSASGTNWSCSASGQTVTCDFSGGTIAASGGTSTISLVVSTSAGTGGQTLANYASIDPTGGASPPTPGASCTPGG
jgi:uncharacterized repeat protein (TIGR01451 family)